MKEIQLGEYVQDIVTGFEGITTARVQYLNGCIQYCVKSKATDNSISDGEYIDEGQLKVIKGKGMSVSIIKSRDPGGFMSDTPPAEYHP